MNYFIYFTSVVIVPKHSLYQPLLYVGSVFCVFEVVLYWYRCSSVLLHVIFKKLKRLFVC